MNNAERIKADNQFNNIINEMKKHGLPDVAILRKAYQFALEKHNGTTRNTGEAYIFHPLAVAQILADNGHESDVITCALLHDTVEDCDVSEDDIEKEFGSKIAKTVNAVTKVDDMFESDGEMAKMDIDTLSDVKFLTESSVHRKAVYIKCADRIHNLRTIEGVEDFKKRKKKAQHTRDIIIPAAKRLHIHRMVDELGSLCLKIENPALFKQLKTIYQQILVKNNDTFKGYDGLIESTCRTVMNNSLYGSNVVNFFFEERSEDSLFSDLSLKLNNINDISESFIKDNAALYDVYFITDDMYSETPENLFFKFYEELHTSKHRFTIIGISKSVQGNDRYYLMADRYGIKYRVFMQSYTEHLEYTHGIIVSEEMLDYRKEMARINNAEPDLPEQSMIRVFRKDGSSMQIEAGATVLDFAFAIDRNIGICARYAHLNGNASQIPVYTKLKHGDIVEVISDHDKDNPSRDIPHATVRWFEYLHTRSAVKDLSRWLEKHMDVAIPTMLVFDSKGAEYEIEMAATVLDFAFAVNDSIGLHVKNAYLNKSKKPVNLDRILRYGDKVTFEYDSNDTETPEFTWLNIVKTKYAKATLIDYFNNKYNS